MIAYSLTIFLGAFLLFQVQPLMGKYILPWFGGSPGVWTTCLLFFQSALLAGYAYAHFSAQRLTPKRQAGVHVVLLILALALLPIIPAESWKPQVPGDPTSSWPPPARSFSTGAAGPTREPRPTAYTRCPTPARCSPW